MPCESFVVEWDHGNKFRFQQRLAKWLKKLPKPCGVFAANDDTAAQVSDACYFAGLRCPQDVAIVGVDNYPQCCENAVTSLSSIEIDFKEAGRLSADLLARLIANPALPPERVHYGPGRIVRRQSTRRLQTTDACILRAVENIRRGASLGLKAADVIRETGLSRRSAELRFRKATGKSILQEIYDVRLEHVLSFLEQPNFPISQIAEMCGWQSSAFLQRIFKQRTGMTMREWRNDRRPNDQRSEAGSDLISC